LCPPPRRDRDTTRTRGILAFYGFGLDEIAAYVNGTSDPDMEAEAERLLHQTDPPVGPPPERAEFVALAEMVAARDALRHRAAQALALSGWDTEDVSAVLRGTADTASTVDAANALSRAGFGFGDTLASLPGLPGLAVAA
jgi:hypothetical protein